MTLPMKAKSSAAQGVTAGGKQRRTGWAKGWGPLYLSHETPGHETSRNPKVLTLGLALWPRHCECVFVEFGG